MNPPARPHYLLPHRHRSPSKSHLYPLQKIEQGVETVEDKCNNNANFLVDSNIDAVVYKGKVSLATFYSFDASD